MKKSIMLLTVFSVILQADFIDTIVSKIKSKRESNLTQEELKQIESPIIEISKKEIIKDGNTTIEVSKENIDTFVLKAIMNKKAFINNKWVGIGEKVGNYKLVDIMDDSVYLTNGKKSKMVFFKKTNQKTIQIINR